MLWIYECVYIWFSFFLTPVCMSEVCEWKYTILCWTSIGSFEREFEVLLDPQKDFVNSTLYDINKILFFLQCETSLRKSDVWLSLLWFCVKEQSIILFLKTLFERAEYAWHNTRLSFEKSSSWYISRIPISEPIGLLRRFTRWTMYLV